ncbi:MAG: redox-sensing transcriptional repressor Rex [Bacilli bacterium]|nr:redox-sensing transcriptional repressor Rex [Bacilli bacterium]
MKTFSMNQLERYPAYLKYFKELRDQGVEYVSSPRIGAKLGYSEEQVRKDLQCVSVSAGRPKRGRSVEQLIEDLETFLGYRDVSGAIVIGVGHLGGALMNFPSFNEMGLEILAGFDVSPSLIGQKIGGKEVYDYKRLHDLMPKLNAHIAIICVPASIAQSVVDSAVCCGAKGIWNFAPTHLDVPEGVVVETVDLASSLAVLSHRMNEANAKKR